MSEMIHVVNLQKMWDLLTIPPPAARHVDKDKPREPPPPATPLQFPRCQPCRRSVPELGASNELAKLFSSTLRTGPTARHLQALNVSLANELSLDQVVPTDFIPPHSWSTNPATSECSASFQAASSRTTSLSNGAPTPGREEFFVRVKELLYDSDDAFRALQRQPPLPHRQPARVVHFRKFWEGLLLVVEHWDASLDKYSDSRDLEKKSAMDVDELRSVANNAESGMEKDKDECKEKTYTGRRTSTGRDMPGKYREETVFAFIETLTWPFRCKLNQAHSQQRLELQGTMIPIVHAASVYRVPKDVSAARRGVAEGPMLGVFCREQTSFRSHDEAEGEGKQEILDLLRETGLMLMLAQRRAREGKEEDVPGKGKWWANAPRWGGGAGGELGDANEETNGDPTSSESSRKRFKKASRMDAWKSMQPPSSTWDRGVTYQQIGKDKNSEHDDIYIVSSINHHISILHLRIHQKYIDYIRQTPAQSNVSNAPQQPWYALEMKRSRWFDLLVADDRVEAMRGIWAILGWQMRDMTEENEDVTISTTMNDGLKNQGRRRSELGSSLRVT